MAYGIDKDEFLYDLDNLTHDGNIKNPGWLRKNRCSPKKSKAKRTSSKSAGESTAKFTSDTPPESSLTTSLELEKLKNQNLKHQLEIRKAELDLARSNL